jgi:hypothetical protein
MVLRRRYKSERERAREREKERKRERDENGNGERERAVSTPPGAETTERKRERLLQWLTAKFYCNIKEQTNAATILEWYFGVETGLTSVMV